MMTKESLRRAVDFGLQNGKKNMIVDLDVLAALFVEVDSLTEKVERVEAAESRWRMAEQETDIFRKRCEKLQDKVDYAIQEFRELAEAPPQHGETPLIAKHCMQRLEKT